MHRSAFALLLCLLLGACGDPALAITPRAIATFTPTEEPLPTRTPRPQPGPTRTPAPTSLWVANTGREGAVLRDAPAGATRVTGLPEGTRLTPQGEEENLDGRRWLRVQEPGGRIGWVAADLTSATPPPTPSPRR